MTQGNIAMIVALTVFFVWLGIMRDYIVLHLSNKWPTLLMTFFVVEFFHNFFLVLYILISVFSSDKESYFHRVMSACLLSWKQFMSSVPPESQKDVTPIYHSVMKSAKFWKLAKHSSAMVRSGRS